MRDFIVGTAGHVDHGKTLLVKAMTGTDADRWEEEKRRGITLDIGFATLAGEEGTLHFVDLPGHERFIKNMLAGATGVDVCLLVIAADESVMPQTVEHAEIVRLLGIRRGVVALNKVDLVDQETRELAQLEISEFLDGLGFGEWPVVPVSAVSGEGVDELVKALTSACSQVPGRDAGRPFRMPVDRVFPVKGFGTVVTGTVVDGSLKAGEPVEVHPEKGSSRARSLQVFGRDVPCVAAGQRAALNLPDLHHLEVRRGCLAASPGSLWPTHLLDVRVGALSSARFPIKTGALLALHIHTQEVQAHVHFEGRPALTPGESVLAQLRLPEPVMAWPGDRFILRLPAPAGTVAGGEVLLVAKRKARWARPADQAMARFLQDGNRLGALLAEAGALGITVKEASARLGLTPESAERLAGQAGAGCVRWGGGAWWLSPGEAKAWLDRASKWLKARQEREAVEWVPRQELLGRWQRVLGKRSEALLAALLEEDLAEAKDDKIRTAGHRVHLTPGQKVAWAAILDILGKGLVMRTAAELEEEAGPEVRPLLPLLSDTGEIVRFKGQFFIAPATLSRIRSLLVEHSRDNGPTVGVPEFKDMVGATRKYVMPLLEYLDDLKWTRREGEGRRILL